MSTTAPLLTIALPVYNGGSTLRVAVQSIIDQTFENWELLIIDDGSHDGMVDALPQLNDPRVRVLCDGDNKGLSARLNEAVETARGRYFARMDHDDICHPDRFSQQISYLAENQEVDLIGALCVTINEQSHIVGSLPQAVTHEEICNRPWLGFYLPHPTWCGKIEWFRSNPYKQDPPPYCCEDQELLLRAHSTSRFHALPQNLLAYRVRTNTPMKRLWPNRLAWLNEQVRYFDNNQQGRNKLLSYLAVSARVLNDLKNKIFYFSGLRRLFTKVHTLPNDEKHFWETRIAKLEKTQ